MVALPLAPTPIRQGRRVPAWWRDAAIAAMWLLLLAVVALWVRDGGLVGISSPAVLVTSLGRVTGLIAAALLLVQVLLMARVPWIERAWVRTDWPARIDSSASPPST